MCVFTHITAGAIIGVYSPNPAAAAALGLGSHVVLDVLPHHDIDNVAVEISLAVAVVVALALGGAITATVIVGMIFAILPDLENLLWKLGKIPENKKFFPGHRGIISHGRVLDSSNLIIQFVFAIFTVSYLLWRR
ncbi:MAG: hypothetical protein B6D63_02340 [Candidatus Latescibacteria bacterium 4484_7]|nr:MAG: hypothetical protein B6D63_02340 [Candidatus Latescibacteria bacterium 4484_7]RKZ07027.1 MAG: hypothetical protein DRQ05_03810 [bacterium]